MEVIDLRNHDMVNYAFLFKKYPATNVQVLEDETTFIAKTRVRFTTNLRKNAFLPAETKIMECLKEGEKLISVKHIGIDFLFDKDNNPLIFRTFKVKFITGE